MVFSCLERFNAWKKINFDIYFDDEINDMKLYDIKIMKTMTSIKKLKSNGDENNYIFSKISIMSFCLQLNILLTI